MTNLATLAAMAALCGGLSGCSTVMEAERPSATNLDRFVVGQRRVDIIAEVGPPLSTIDDTGAACDVYKMHTKGTNAAGKVGIIFGEAAADVFTLGLAEVALTPVEAASKAGLHTVMFCYDANQKLASMRDAGNTRNIGPPLPSVSAPQASGHVSAVGVVPTAIRPAADHGSTAGSPPTN